MQKTLFISTGEVSGDLHGGVLAKALFEEAKKKSIELTIYGVGGDKMRDAGVLLIADTTSISAIGLWEAIPLILPTINIQRKINKILKQNSPDALILIDYMGPNINIGNAMRSSKSNIPIIYYIAPQEWAWRVGSNSTTDLISFTNKIFAIFKLEADFYSRRGGDVSWVGHPMLDMVETLPSRSVALKKLNLSSSEKIILVMPASRPQEIKYLMPKFMKGVKRLQLEDPNLIVFVLASRSIFESKILKSMNKFGVKGRVIPQKEVSHLRKYIYSLTTLALCKSGTVNMELALNNIPQVVGYKVSRVTAFIAKRILNFKVNYISPVNLILKSKLIPELVQKEFTVENIYSESTRILNNPDAREEFKNGYNKLKLELGEPGVAKRAALEIIDYLS
tara:strand:- start:8855 stop:10033 length:1179 start_codon:yes stop_codon:yes gene_type:complete